jgi:hypothetical protein
LQITKPEARWTWEEEEFVKWSRKSRFPGFPLQTLLAGNV